MKSVQALLVAQGESEHIQDEPLVLLVLHDPPECPLDHISQWGYAAYEGNDPPLLPYVDELAGAQRTQDEEEQRGGGGLCLIEPKGAPHEAKVTADHRGGHSCRHVRGQVAQA